MKYSDIKFCTRCKQYKSKEAYSRHFKRSENSKKSNKYEVQ